MDKFAKYLPSIKKSFPDYRFSWEIATEIINGEVAKKPVWLDIGARNNARLQTHQGSELAVGLDPEARDDIYTDSRTKFIRGSAYDLPFKESTYDFVTSRYTFEHLEFPEKALAEIERVLKLGGLFLLQTTNKNSPLLVIARMIPFGIKKQLLKLLFKENPSGTFRTYYKLNTPSKIEKFDSGLQGSGKLKLEKMYLIEDILCDSKILFTMSFNLYKLTRLFGWKSLEGNMVMVFKKVE